MTNPTHNIFVGDLVKLLINRTRGKSRIMYGVVLRVDTWSSQMVDLYVLWHDGELYWCTSNAVEKLNS